MARAFSKKLDSVEFSFYSAEEAKKLGAVEITSISVYEPIKKPKKSSKAKDPKDLKDPKDPNDTAKPEVIRKPMQGGLADTRLGVSLNSRLNSETCVVCNQDPNSCQGHLGYITLCTPAYNPFAFDILYKLLKSKCAFCHRLKLPNDKSHMYILKKQLIKRGKLLDALNIEDLLSDKYVADSGIDEFDPIRDTIMAHKDLVEDIAIESANCGESEAFSTLIKASNDIDSQIWKNFSGNICAHCNEKQPKIAKEGDCKIIRIPLKDK